MSNARADKQFKTIMNAVMKDEEWRAVKSPRMWKRLKQVQTLGFEEWSPLAQATVIQLITNARSVEKITIMDQTLDAVGRIGFATPNIDNNDKTEQWDIDLPEEGNGEMEVTDLDDMEEAIEKKRKEKKKDE